MTVMPSKSWSRRIYETVSLKKLPPPQTSIPKIISLSQTHYITLAVLLICHTDIFNSCVSWEWLALVFLPSKQAAGETICFL